MKRICCLRHSATTTGKREVNWHEEGGREVNAAFAKYGNRVVATTDSSLLDRIEIFISMMLCTVATGCAWWAYGHCRHSVYVFTEWTFRPLIPISHQHSSFTYRSMDLFGPKGHRIPPPTSRRWLTEPPRLSSTPSSPSEREPSRPMPVMLAPEQWYHSSPSSQGSPAIFVLPPKPQQQWRPSDESVAFVERVTMGGNRLAIKRAQNLAAGRYSIGLQPKPLKVRGKAKKKQHGQPRRASPAAGTFEPLPSTPGARPFDASIPPASAALAGVAPPADFTRSSHHSSQLDLVAAAAPSAPPPSMAPASSSTQLVLASQPPHQPPSLAPAEPTMPIAVAIPWPLHIQSANNYQAALSAPPQLPPPGHTYYVLCNPATQPHSSQRRWTGGRGPP